MEMCNYPNRFLHPYTAQLELGSHVPPSDTCSDDPQTHSESVLMSGWCGQVEVVS